MTQATPSKVVRRAHPQPDPSSEKPSRLFRGSSIGQPLCANAQDSVGAQRDHLIYLRGSAGWNIAGEQSNRTEQDHHCDKGERIIGGGVEQQRPDEP